MRARYLSAALAAAAVFPAGAAASTVSIGAANPNLAVFRSGPGASDVTALGSIDATAFTFTEATQRLRAGSGCTPVNTRTATCGGPGATGPLSADVRLGGGDDRFSGASKGGTVLTVAGGPGDDDIQANGDTSDAWGDDGDDTIRVSGNGTAIAHGGPGADQVRGGSAFRLKLYGGDHDDLVVSGAGINELHGDAGGDAIVAEIGNGTVSGGSGGDTILAAGVWTIDAGSGSDTIVDSSGNTVNAGDGNDLIDVTGGFGSTVQCGRGFDTVHADADDSVASDCEVRVAGPLLASAAVERARVRAAGALGIAGR